ISHGSPYCGHVRCELDTISFYRLVTTRGGHLEVNDIHRIVGLDDKIDFSMNGETRLLTVGVQRKWGFTLHCMTRESCKTLKVFAEDKRTNAFLHLVSMRNMGGTQGPSNCSLRIPESKPKIDVLEDCMREHTACHWVPPERAILLLSWSHRLLRQSQ